jgi:hypothetical protein
MRSYVDTFLLSPGIHLQGGALAPSVRRDVRDLNQQFLDLGTAPGTRTDPRFAWPEALRSAVLRTDATARERMAACPFTLFELRLLVEPSTPAATRPGVADSAASAESAESWQALCMAFVHFALYVAWQLADRSPMAARMAFGLSAVDELRLNEMTLGDVSRLGDRTDVIRPRWPAHPAFWALLCDAAHTGCEASLRRAHCLGLCLMDGPEPEPSPDDGGSVPRHRPSR